MISLIWSDDRPYFPPIVRQLILKAQETSTLASAPGIVTTTEGREYWTLIGWALHPAVLSLVHSSLTWEMNNGPCKEYCHKTCKFHNYPRKLSAWANEELAEKTNVSQLNREQPCHKLFLISMFTFSPFVSYHSNYFHVVLDIFQQFLSLDWISVACLMDHTHCLPRHVRGSQH